MLGPLNICENKWYHLIEAQINIQNMILPQRRSQGGAEGAQAPPLAIRILMFIFLVIHQHCKSRSGVLQNVLRQYHKA